MPRRSVALAVFLAALLCGCAALPPGSDFSRRQSSALEHPEETRLGRSIETAARKHEGKSGFHLLPAGSDGLLARVQMADAAERTLDVQYYLYREDDTSRLLTDAILRAADRGVRVRVLLDDLDAAGREARTAALDAHPNIEVRLFNPFAYRGRVRLVQFVELALNAPRLKYRMHNKLLVADNQIALVGGRNVGNEYFQASTEFEFADYDVFAAGPIVRRLSESFDSHWNNPIAIPIAALGGTQPPEVALDEYRKALAEHLRRGTDYMRELATGEPLAGMISGEPPLVWAHAEVVWDSPDKANVENGEAFGWLRHRPVDDAAAALRSELLIVSPYFVPGKEGMRFLEELRQRDVRIRVLTNSLKSTDASVAHAGYARYRPALLEKGIELHEVRPERDGPAGRGTPFASVGAGLFSLHAKVFVFDRQKLFIGSMNFDRRSMLINTELGLIIDSPELARQVAAHFESIADPANSYEVMLGQDDGGGSPRLRWRTGKDGEVVELDAEPARSLWQHLTVGFLLMLPLDALLGETDFH